MEQDAKRETIEEPSDECLMELVVQGDQEAFDYIYLRYKSQLQRFIKGFLGDDESVEDILQEAFFRVYRNAESYKPTHRFSSWLYRIATNLCLNELRRRRTHPIISLNQQVQFAVTDSESETVELHELIPDSCFAGPGEAVESSETADEISSALDELSDAHKEVVQLRLYGEMKYEEIAGILNCSVGTVKSRAFYGLRALREKLDSMKAPE